jgi:NAD+ kinase
VSVAGIPHAPRVLVVLKRSSWRKWVEEEADARIVALLDAGDETVRRMRPAHIDHAETIEEVRRALADLGTEVVWHDRPHHFRVDGPCDLVVTVGGDGTLLGASHGIGPDVPLLGVNSAPAHSIGFFCAARKGQVREALAAALAGSLERVELTRMRVELNGAALHDRVLNEALFCHSSPAATSRYILRVQAHEVQATVSAPRVLAEEEHKSSGLWVGPAAGSTAAQRSAGGCVLPLDSPDLQYVAREPYRPHGEPLKLTMGLVVDAQSLDVKSRMRQARVFLDGDHLVHDVTIGDVVTMRRSSEPLVVLGLKRQPT